MTDRVLVEASPSQKGADGAGQRTLTVAHVHTTLVGSGGDRVSELQARYIALHGHQVTMIGPATAEIVDRLSEHGIAIVDNPVETRNPEAVLQRTGPLDIVHCHCMVSAPFAAQLAQASGAALVIHNHSMGEAWWEGTSITSRMRSKRRQQRRSIDAAVAVADRVLCVSGAVRDHMRTIGLHSENVSLLPNPIDDIFFRERVSTGEPYDVAILATPSRAKSPFTALRVLAKASRLRPGLRLIWMGPLGRWGPVLQNFAKLLALSNLTFAGRLTSAQICDVLDVTRVLVSASNREGQPLSVLEALIRQCSALLSDIPAHRSFVPSKGIDLFSANQVNQSAKKLIGLLDDHTRVARPHLAPHKLEAHGQALLEIYSEHRRQRQAA